MKKRLVVAGCLALFSLSGCSTKSAPIVEYNLDSKLGIEPLEKTKCINNSLQVALPFSQKSLESQQMSYRVGLSKEYAYNQSLWTQAPTKSIAQQLVETLSKSKIFKTVQLYKSRAKTDYLLETDVEDFMQYFSKDEQSSYGVVTLRFTLIDRKNATVIETARFSTQVDVKQLNAEGGVDALSEALSKVLVQNVEWLHKVCR